MCAQSAKRRLDMKLLTNEVAEGPVHEDALETLWLALDGNGWEWLAVDSR